VKDFEDYMHSVHKTVMKSGVCGFDQWVDNHYAYDGEARSTDTKPLDTYVANAKKLGYPYHWWALPANRTQVYIIDPTGFGVQYDGPATNPPANLPTYSAACKSNDGCAGQGICTPMDFFFL
jgi:hypothetical protein